MLLELAATPSPAHNRPDPTHPGRVQPVLVAEKRQPLVEWLIVELGQKYNIPKKIARPG